jgi:hypothetical protein
MGKWSFRAYPGISSSLWQFQEGGKKLGPRTKNALYHNLANICKFVHSAGLSVSVPMQLRPRLEMRQVTIRIYAVYRSMNGCANWLIPSKRLELRTAVLCWKIVSQSILTTQGAAWFHVLTAKFLKSQFYRVFRFVNIYRCFIRSCSLYLQVQGLRIGQRTKFHANWKA